MAIRFSFPTPVRSISDTEESLSQTLAAGEPSDSVSICAYLSPALPQALLESTVVKFLVFNDLVEPLHFDNVAPGAWDRLVSLQINHCGKGVSFSERLASLPALQTIDLDHLHLVQLPKGPWPALKDLSITYSSLAEPLPDHILDLPTIESIDLTNTSVAALCMQSISRVKEGQLQGIRRLALMNISVTAVPEGLEALPSLTELSLAGCPISSFPTTSKDAFPALVHLKLHFCTALHELPASIQWLPHLESLVLSRGGLTALPHVDVGGFPALNNLDLVGCAALGAIPDEYYLLPELRCLAASECALGRQ